ncbi:NIF family HAD-type phosphatase [Flagellimonas marinaquae]
MNNLCLLDLDHTLIYGSYAPSEQVELLFAYSEYLKVYKRPYVDKFIDFLNETYEAIIVYTTAKEDYADGICSELHIDVKALLSRNDCLSENDRFYKCFRPNWAQEYRSIHIIDDSPNIWLDTENYDDQIAFIVPKEFRGEIGDEELLAIEDVIRNKRD